MDKQESILSIHRWLEYYREDTFDLFDVHGKEPFLFALGDEVQFYEITKQQFWEMKSKGV